MGTRIHFGEVASRRSDPFDYNGKQYVLVEATGADAIEWRNAGMKASRWSPDGKVVSVEGLADTEALLVSKCLREIKADGTEGRVAVGFVKDMPARMMRTLFDAAQTMSGLREDGTDPRAQQFANLLTRPDCPVGYQVLRDYVRAVCDGPDGTEYPNLRDFLEAPDRGPKS